MDNWVRWVSPYIINKLGIHLNDISQLGIDYIVNDTTLGAFFNIYFRKRSLCAWVVNATAGGCETGTLFC